MTKNNYLLEGGRVFFFDDYFFSKPVLIPGADHATFEAIETWFAKDARHVYFLYKAVESADPGSFVYLGGYNDQWAKDTARAYHFEPTKAARRIRAIESKSLARFAVLPHCRFCEYAGDSEHVYYKGRLIRHADASSFQLFTQDRMGAENDSPSYHFARDAQRIYFNGQPIWDAHYDSFTVIHEPGIGHDEYGVDLLSAYRQSPQNGRVARLRHDALPAAVLDHFRKKSGSASRPPA